MRRASATRRAVVALVAALTLLAAPLARAQQAPAPETTSSSGRPGVVIGFAAAFAVTLFVLIWATRASAVDTSRLRAATGKIDEALAKGRGGRRLAAASYHTRVPAVPRRAEAAPRPAAARR